MRRFKIGDWVRITKLSAVDVELDVIHVGEVFTVTKIFEYSPGEFTVSLNTPNNKWNYVALHSQMELVDLIEELEE